MKTTLSKLAVFGVIGLGLGACTTDSEPKEEPTPAIETQAQKEEAAEKELDEAIQIALDTVYFAFDSFSLTDDAVANLKKMAAAMVQIPGVKVLVEGHADERGSNEYNLALAQKRADAIKDFLLSEGVSSDAIETASFGEERLAVHGQSETEHAKNRRGEFKRLN